MFAEGEGTAAFAFRKMRGKKDKIFKTKANITIPFFAYNESVIKERMMR